MATVLPFNCISIDGQQIAGPADFIYGSGSLTLNGEDSAATTADGMIHNYRSAMTLNASAEVKGDLRSIDSGHPGTGAPWASLPEAITLGLVSERGGAVQDIKEFEGIISVEYDSSTNKSSVTITGTEEAE